jgi:radical SAM superfamily enzyme YgiQ (UPF0313 family)
MAHAVLVRAELPNRAGRQGSLPQGILAIAEYVQRHGHTCTLIDTIVQPEWPHLLDRALLERAEMVGIGSLSGPILHTALRVARHVRTTRPEIQIVWGGVHASLCPGQLEHHPLCDLVVVGEGEMHTVDILDGQYPRYHAFRDLNTTGPLPYHLLPLDRYGIRGDTWFPYHSSRGCPHRCKFCSNESLSRNVFRAQSAAVVVENVAQVVKDLGVRMVNFTDDEFFIDPERVDAICTLWRHRLPGVKWTAACRFNTMARCSVDYWRMVKASGCVRLSAGAECGNNRMLRYVRKGITVEQIVEGVRRVTAAGLDLYPLSFVSGFPTETERDLLDRCDLIDTVRAGGGRRVIVNGVFGLTLYPGTTATAEAQTYGVAPPKTVEGWANSRFGAGTAYPWLSARYRSMAATIGAIVRLGYFWRMRSFRGIRNPVLRFAVVLGQLPFLTSGWVRWRFRWFGWAPEWRLWVWMCNRFLGTI